MDTLCLMADVVPTGKDRLPHDDAARQAPGVGRSRRRGRRARMAARVCEELDAELFHAGEIVGRRDG